MKLPDMPNEELVNLTLFQAKIIPYFADDERNKAELLKRLNDGQEAIALVHNINTSLFWEGRLQNLDVLLKRLDEGENLKCCGSCTMFSHNIKDCPHFRRAVAHKYCDKWQSDGMKREDRII